MYNIEEAQDRYDKATHGVWSSDNMNIFCDGECEEVLFISCECSPVDAEFVVKAHEVDIPNLLKEVRRLRAGLFLIADALHDYGGRDFRYAEHLKEFIDGIQGMAEQLLQGDDPRAILPAIHDKSKTEAAPNALKFVRLEELLAELVEQHVPRTCESCRYAGFRNNICLTCVGDVCPNWAWKGGIP